MISLSQPNSEPVNTYIKEIQDYFGGNNTHVGIKLICILAFKNSTRTASSEAVLETFVKNYIFIRSKFSEKIQNYVWIKYIDFQGFWYANQNFYRFIIDYLKNNNTSFDQPQNETINNINMSIAYTDKIPPFGDDFVKLGKLMQYYLVTKNYPNPISLDEFAGIIQTYINKSNEFDGLIKVANSFKYYDGISGTDDSKWTTQINQMIGKSIFKMDYNLKTIPNPNDVFFGGSLELAKENGSSQITPKELLAKHIAYQKTILKAMTNYYNNYYYNVIIDDYDLLISEMLIHHRILTFESLEFEPVELKTAISTNLQPSKWDSCFFDYSNHIIRLYKKGKGSPFVTLQYKNQNFIEPRSIDLTIDKLNTLEYNQTKLKRSQETAFQNFKNRQEMGFFNFKKEIESSLNGKILDVINPELLKVKNGLNTPNVDNSKLLEQVKNYVSLELLKIPNSEGEFEKFTLLLNEYQKKVTKNYDTYNEEIKSIKKTLGDHGDRIAKVETNYTKNVDFKNGLDQINKNHDENLAIFTKNYNEKSKNIDTLSLQNQDFSKSINEINLKLQKLPSPKTNPNNRALFQLEYFVLIGMLKELEINKEGYEDRAIIGIMDDDQDIITQVIINFKPKFDYHNTVHRKLLKYSCTFWIYYFTTDKKLNKSLETIVSECGTPNGYIRFGLYGFLKIK